MKKLILLSLLLNFSTYLFAQDIIITKNDERIEAKIVRDYGEVIKYALFNDQKGPTFLILKTKIKTITYENGEVENFEHFIPKSGKIYHPEKTFTKVIRINPVPTVISAINDFFELDLQMAFYISPKLAIPVHINLAAGSGLSPNFPLTFGWGTMIGIEAVPVTHQQKSGLFLNALAGFVSIFSFPNSKYFDRVAGIGFVANVNMGYQLITKEGFVLNVAAGPIFDSLTMKINPRIILAFGIAF